MTILTRKATTSSGSFATKGSAIGQVTQVTYRVGKKGPFKKTIGTATGSFKAKRKPGKNTITVITEGPGGTSAAETVVMTRN